MTATPPSHRHQGTGSLWALKSYLQKHQHCILHLLPTRSPASLITRGCFAGRNFISFMLLTLFWEADSRTDAMLQCQALNPCSSCSPGQGQCLSLSKELCPLLRHGKMPLGSGYFQFPAPVLKLPGPFSSTSAGQTNLHFLAQSTLFSTAPCNLKGQMKYFLSAAQLTTISGKC